MSQAPLFRRDRVQREASVCIWRISVLS